MTQVKEDVSAYVTKYGHVSTACRLNVEDELLLLQHVKTDPVRKQFLSAVAEAGKREPGAEAVKVPFEGAPCEVGGNTMNVYNSNLGLQMTGAMAQDNGAKLQGPSKPFFSRAILPNFSVLDRSCLWWLGARMWRVNLPSCVKSIPNSCLTPRIVFSSCRRPQVQV